MRMGLTALERACVEAIVCAHWPALRLDGLTAARREYTGVGSYVYLVDVHEQDLPDGVYEAGSRMVEMQGLRFGLDFAVTVTGQRMDFLEIVAPGPVGWDGVERPWRML